MFKKTNSNVYNYIVLLLHVHKEQEVSQLVIFGNQETSLNKCDVVILQKTFLIKPSCVIYTVMDITSFYFIFYIKQCHHLEPKNFVCEFVDVASVFELVTSVVPLSSAAFYLFIF